MTNGEHCCSPFVIDYQSDTTNDLINAPLVFVLVEKEVLFGGVVRPNVFDGIVGFAFVVNFLKVLNHFHGST